MLHQNMAIEYIQSVGEYKLHSGTDVGAPVGTNFVAMADGIVTKACYNGRIWKLCNNRPSEMELAHYMHMAQIYL